MRTTAAVAVEAGKPLEIMEVNLEGPKAGEVLVEVKATGLCHTDDFTLSGGDPEGLFPAILGHEGAGVVVEVGPGVTSLEVGDHVIPLYTPECRECNHTVVPEIALAKVRKDAPFDKICYIGCGVTTGIGAVINTAKVEMGSTAIVFGLGGIGLNVIQGLRLAGADQIVGVDLNPDKKPMADKFGMTHFVNPDEVEGDLVAHLVELTGGGGDYTFDATGNVGVMRAALESAHKGWGESVVIGVAPAGAEISTRPFQLVTGRVWKGTAFGGARGRTDVPKIVDWYMDGKIEIDPMITHTIGLEDINKGFDMMHAGESIRSVVVY
jgi:S-(hydroxymethyl)glutathione dehydrogenase/alcohol dehydrogenase